MTEQDESTQTRARDQFDTLVRDLRDELHRYCTRMVGSSIEGEDVVQEALAKAYYQLSRSGGVVDLKRWLFRIAHNKAIDHLRRYDVRFGERLDAEIPVSFDESPVEAQEVARWALTFFAKLTVLQRSCVILKDVLGYALDEISEVLDASVPAIKGALHRGRARLRRLADASNTEAHAVVAPDLTTAEARLVERYVERFNARDFDALRDMLADDVRLDMVSRAQRLGAEDVGDYFTRYAQLTECRLRVGTVEGHLAILGRDSEDDSQGFFVLLEWQGERIGRIRDFRYARWVLDEA